MSRIGKKAVPIPAGVTLTLDGQKVTVKGPKGELSWTVVDEIEVSKEGDGLTFAPRNDSQRSRGMWGLSRTLVANMVQGVTDIRHRGSDPGQQQLAGFREPDAAGGPVHQPNAEPFFQLAQPLAQAGNRDALLQRRAPEIPGTGDGDESIEIAQVQIAHCPIY